MYYIDNHDITDPWFNLAFEEYAVRNLDRNNDYLLLYINQPCIIIGKHQNVVEEVNLVNAGKLKIPIIRRISGGGTVYHDLGNLNISVITTQTYKNINKYFDFLKPILEILKELDLDVHLNERNNIILNNKKISGNAQFTSRQRLLSHGTLLVNSDLPMINQLIKSKNHDYYFSKSSKSIHSQVTNINDHLKQTITTEEIKDKILSRIFGKDILCFEIDKNYFTEIKKLSVLKYRSWQWNYGLSPACTIKKTIESVIGELNLEIHIVSGLIKKFSISNHNLNFMLKETIGKYFIDQRFDYLTIQKITKKIKDNTFIEPLNELSWLNILLN